MAIYCAYPSPPRLEENTNRFLAAMRAGAREPQNQLFTQIAFDFVDSQMEALFFGPTRQIELTGFRRKLVDGLGGVIEKTTHGLIKTVVSRLDNKELATLAPFVAARQVMLPQADGTLRAHVSFPLTQHYATRFTALHEASMAGDPKQNLAASNEIMCEFIDTALDYMFKQPTDLIKLGFIARKAVDVGHSSIRSLSHSTVHKMSADLSDEELRRMSTYFYELMKEGPDPA